MHTALMVILLVTSVILILSILLQSSKSDGLSGSIAGGAFREEKEQRIRRNSV